MTVSKAKNAAAKALGLDVILQQISAAAVLAILNIATAVSIGTLVFSGPLAPAVSVGIGAYLIATAMSGCLVPAFSGYKAMISGPRSGQAPIFAAMAAAIASGMAGTDPEVIAVTVVAAMLTTTVIVGLFMYAVGAARMGSVARYIPFPVMAGFFAGLGFLLTRGGVAVAVGPIADPSSLMSFLTSEALFHIAPAIFFGVLLFWLEQRISHWILVPAYLIAAIGIFYLVLFATGTSIDAATDLGWLTQFDTEADRFFPIITLDQLSLINWPSVAEQYDTILILCLLSVIMLLFDISGVEILINRDLDPNRELRSAGLANVAGAGATGLLGFGATADTALARKLGGTTFLMIAIYVAIVIGAIIAGPAPIAFVPAPIVGGFLIYIGVSFLIDWVWKQREKLPLADVIVIVIILFTVAFYGILEGVGVGVLLATVLFVHKYSKLSVIKSAMNATEHISNVDRHRDDQAFLDANGHRVHLMVLQGFLFFGSANQLLEQIKRIIEGGDESQTRYLIIDFKQVSEMDSSAANSFSKLMQICARENLILCLAGENPSIINRLDQLHAELDLPNGTVQIFPDLETAAGWADDDMLSAFEDSIPADEVMDAEALLSDLIGDANAVSTIMPYFERVQINKGEALFEQGTEGDALYLILGGAMSIVFTFQDRQPMTVRTMRAGSILGEMAVYTGAPRSASAVARRDSVLFRLSTQRFRALAKENPVAAELFSAYIVKLMAERLARSNKSVQALSR